IFNRIYEEGMALQTIWASRILNRLKEAFKVDDWTAQQDMIRLYSEVGIPDFQFPLWEIIIQTVNVDLQEALLNALAATGNQTGATLVYDALKSSPQRVLLETLSRLGIPDFSRRVFKSRNAVERYMKKSRPERNDFLFRERFIQFQKKMETIFERLRLNDREKSFYRAKLFQDRGSTSPLPDQKFNYRGIVFEEGDIVLTSGTEPDSLFWGFLTEFEVGFSHVQIVTFTDEGFPVLADIGETIRFTHIEDALGMTGDFLVLRRPDLTEEQKKKINNVIAAYHRERVRTWFDLSFDKTTDYAFYCSEFIFHVFNRADIPMNWVFSRIPTERMEENVKRLGITVQEFITQGDYLRMPDFKLIGWRYNRAAREKTTGRILAELYFDHIRTEQMNMKRMPNALWYRYITVFYRLQNVRNARKFSKSLEYTMITFFLSFRKIYHRANKQAEKLGLRFENLRLYKQKMRSIFLSETAPVFNRIFLPSTDLFVAQAVGGIIESGFDGLKADSQDSDSQGR
ncbi:MAG: hypothetical protein MUP70_04830, partial [Candidatus Aminicenantes bacterium]|nr:hypothetical protein [Candidatus Aminicenantes bacterium]